MPIRQIILPNIKKGVVRQVERMGKGHELRAYLVDCHTSRGLRLELGHVGEHKCYAQAEDHCGHLSREHKPQSCGGIHRHRRRSQR